MLEVQGHKVIVGVDRSGSMKTRDCEGSTRYHYLQELLATFVEAAAPSTADGKVTALFFSDNTRAEVLRTAAETVKAFEKYPAGGGTTTHAVLETAFKVWQSDQKVPVMLFLATDGYPDYPDQVEKEIVSITQRITNPEDFRIMILTVGVRTPELTAWLEKLDSGLDGAKFDIVGQNSLNQVDFREAASELIESTTSQDEALAGATGGKSTRRID